MSILKDLSVTMLFVGIIVVIISSGPAAIATMILALLLSGIILGIIE